jgi:hypothetical protein
MVPSTVKVTPPRTLDGNCAQFAPENSTEQQNGQKMDKDPRVTVSRENKEILAAKVVGENKEEIAATHAVDRLDMEVWYEPLEEFTFLSKLVQLQPVQARACLNFYEDELCFGSSSLHGTDPLLVIKTAVQDAMEALGGEAFFVRLSTRSPNDMIFGRAKTKILLQQELKKLASRDETNEIIALTRALHKAMRIESAAEAMGTYKILS